VTCKATFFFRDITSSTDAGWTESFFTNAANASACLAAVIAPGWLNTRLAFLPSSYMLASVRAQNVATRFDNKRMRFNQRTGVGQFAVGGRNQPQGESPWQGVLVKLSSGIAVSRLFICRGLTSDVIGENLEYQAPARWDPLFTEWLGQLGDNPQAYQLRKANFGTPILNPTAVTVLVDHKTLQLTWPVGTAPFGLSPGTVFQLKGIQNATPVNGLWRVQGNDTTNVTTLPRRRTIFGTPTVPTTVKIVTYSYFNIDDAEIIRGAERAAGRPSDQLHGRSSARRG
jgi:hypothetical protein